MNDGNDGRGTLMIDREPPNRDINGGRKPDRAVLLKLGAD
jgi:hypothetical protein